MIFFLDECIPPPIARALEVLESSENIHEVYSTEAAFGKGVKDEDLISLIGKRKGILITHDLKQKTRKREVKLFFEESVSVFIISFSSGSNYWAKALKVICEWESIKKISGKKSRTFVCRIKMRGQPEFLFE
ncbi:MAG: hypothetical protein GDA42_05660 [Ekhidna sp.]|nr:hypothetical protein [Ekhidna sp.]MBC6409931.1 hypothetical protein [Ekhidna sp.]